VSNPIRWTKCGGCFEDTRPLEEWRPPNEADYVRFPAVGYMKPERVALTRCDGCDREGLAMEFDSEPEQ